MGDYLFVMYAELSTYGSNAGHGVEGAGKGYVSVFNTDGSFLKRFASKGSLNIPWGVTAAPGSFLDNKDMITNAKENASGSDNNVTRGPKDPVILVAILPLPVSMTIAKTPGTGQLQSHSQTIVIDGLSALSFAPSSATTVDPKRLYFTAGPDQEWINFWVFYLAIIITKNFATVMVFCRGPFSFS